MCCRTEVVTFSTSTPSSTPPSPATGLCKWAAESATRGCATCGPVEHCASTPNSLLSQLSCENLYRGCFRWACGTNCHQGAGTCFSDPSRRVTVSLRCLCLPCVCTVLARAACLIIDCHHCWRMPWQWWHALMNHDCDPVAPCSVTLSQSWSPLPGRTGAQQHLVWE